MNSRTTRRTLLAASPFALASLGLAPIEEKPEAAVREVLDRQVVDWNKGDLDAFLLGYWNDPGVVFQSGGDQHRGFEAMRDRYRKRYQAEGARDGETRLQRPRNPRPRPGIGAGEGGAGSSRSPTASSRAASSP